MLNATLLYDSGYFKHVSMKQGNIVEISSNITDVTGCCYYVSVIAVIIEVLRGPSG